LGGGARTTTLARLEDVEPPRGRLVWSAWRTTLEPGQVLRHRHGTSTVFAEEGEHRLGLGERATVVGAAEGAAVPADTLHRHEAGRVPSTFSEVVLTAPGSPLPRAPRARRLFQSDVLRGVPRRATLQFIEVRLPPGTETSVHTHPGPEFIVGTGGRFDYENAIEGARRFGPGDTAGIPPDTPVQKRNRSDADAVFLSWFLVDPDEPFAPGARFEDARGR
jgi:quercetin dioxygenase-like cupin family protein